METLNKNSMALHEKADPKLAKELWQAIEGFPLPQQKISIAMGMAKAHFCNVLNARRLISVKMAVCLEALGIKTAKYWLTKQMDYQIGLIDSKYVSEVKNMIALEKSLKALKDKRKKK